MTFLGTVLICWTILGLKAPVEPQFSDVFVKGDGGFVQIRIPSVVVTKKGVVLAFAEGRDTDKSDQGSNKILLRRSKDGGRTWGRLQILDDQGADSLNNPCAVVEQKSGRVFLFYQRLPAGLAESSHDIKTGYEGPNIYSSSMVASDDDGSTWTKPVDLTTSVKHPTGATTIASGPGIGIQLTRGPHSGRLIVPFNEGPFYQWNDYSAFSDDRGKTWHTGENVPGAFVTGTDGKTKSQINEVQMVELSDGSVLLNSRQFAGKPVRKAALSHDGGETWSNVYDVPELRDPSCMASVFRYSFGSHDRNLILYSGPDATNRTNGTLHASFDDGKTWPVKRVLVSGRFAYSVLTRLADGSVGCLFETDDYKKIVFARLSLNWLLEKRDRVRSANP